MQILVKIFVYLILFYVIVLIATYFFQRKLIYLPEKVDSVNPAQWGAEQMQVITLQTSDGLSIKAWYQKAESGKPTIAFFHGNAGHIGHRVVNIKPYLQKGYGVLLADYRGYSGNLGEPSEQGLYQDARAAMEFLQQQAIPCEYIILHGESLGAAVAVQMALEYRVALLVLQAPFNRLTDVAKAHYPFLPVKTLLKEKYDSQGKIVNIKVPVLIIHGDKDTIAPMQLSKKLFASANQPKHYVEHPNMQHSDLDPYSIASDVIDFYHKTYAKCELLR